MHRYGLKFFLFIYFFLPDRLLHTVIVPVLGTSRLQYVISVGDKILYLLYVRQTEPSESEP